jgi:hypothetical protein
MLVWRRVGFSYWLRIPPHQDLEWALPTLSPFLLVRRGMRSIISQPEVEPNSVVLNVICNYIAYIHNQ